MKLNPLQWKKIPMQNELVCSDAIDVLAPERKVDRYVFGVPQLSLRLTPYDRDDLYCVYAGNVS